MNKQRNERNSFCFFQKLYHLICESSLLKDMQFSFWNHKHISKIQKDNFNPTLKLLQLVNLSQFLPMKCRSEWELKIKTKEIHVVQISHGVPTTLRLFGCDPHNASQRVHATSCSLVSCLCGIRTTIYLFFTILDCLHLLRMKSQCWISKERWPRAIMLFCLPNLKWIVCQANIEINNTRWITKLFKFETNMISRLNNVSSQN